MFSSNQVFQEFIFFEIGFSTNPNHEQFEIKCNSKHQINLSYGI